MPHLPAHPNDGDTNASAPSGERGRQSLGSVMRAVASDIKIAHTVFAMPFALLAAAMAIWRPVGDASAMAGAVTRIDHGQTSFAWWVAGHIALIVAAMVCARTVAMLANRLLDREIDAGNPRTQRRAIPAGALSLRAALLVLIATSAAFMLVCVLFGVLYGNWAPALLGLPVLAWISAYALFKRFTWLCHIYLGSSLALSPIAAVIAVDASVVIGGGDAFQPAVWLLALMVLCWVAGFDVIYALQDVAVDRDQGLHSIPQRFGVGGAMWISRGLHAIAVGCLVAALLLDARFGVLFGIAVLLVAVLLLYEHATVAHWGTTKLALAFFTLNGVISCVLGALGIADVLL